MCFHFCVLPGGNSRPRVVFPWLLPVLTIGPPRKVVRNRLLNGLSLLPLVDAFPLYDLSGAA